MALVTRVLRDPEFKMELGEMLKWTTRQEDTKEAMIELMKKCVTDEMVKKALTETLQ